MRVAAGAIARLVLGTAVRIRGALVQIGPHRIDRDRWDWTQVDENPFFCPDAVMAQTWETYLSEVRKSGSSAGAVIEIVADGVPPGLGAPLYGKLDADVAGALMSINAVKGVEIGEGFAAAACRARRMPTRCACMTVGSRSDRTMPVASWVASPPGSRSWRGLR